MACVAKYVETEHATLLSRGRVAGASVRWRILKVVFTHHVAPVLVERGMGAIITIASMAGVMGFAGEVVYCATKFAQVGFTQALDRELRPHGIKVGVVCPGGVKTEFAIRTGRSEKGVAESGMLEAEDVAAAALLIATQPQHSRITEIRMRPMVEPLFGRDPV